MLITFFIMMTNAILFLYYIITFYLYKLSNSEPRYIQIKNFMLFIYRILLYSDKETLCYSYTGSHYIRVKNFILL